MSCLVSCLGVDILAQGSAVGRRGTVPSTQKDNPRICETVYIFLNSKMQAAEQKRFNARADTRSSVYYAFFEPPAASRRLLDSSTQGSPTLIFSASN